MKNMISVENLVKKYHTYVAVNDISFKVDKGQVYAFLGPNGAGKSTTMKILSTLLYPNSGKVTLDNINFLMNQRMLKNKIGIVFQENTLDDHLSIYDNLYSRGLLYSMSSKIVKKRIRELANEMGFKEILKKKYITCSGGQKRLVMIARALIHEPELIILDEPTTGLDPQIRNLVWQKLLKYKEEKNLTIFFSSHYMEEATKYADRICMLNRGKIIIEDTPQSLVQMFGDKQLHIKEEKKEYQMTVKNCNEALSILNKLGNHLKSFELRNPSLEDVFLRHSN